jgi:hypothetical protein
MLTYALEHPDLPMNQQQLGQRWLNKSAHSDKWKLCYYQTGAMPEKEAG